MAKLKAPLLSLGASGAIGRSLVFFPWKGIDAVREYVVPSNPKTDSQTTQRGYFTDAIGTIHALEALAVKPLTATDKIAYALWGSTYPTPRTWFNQMVLAWIFGYTKVEHIQFFVDGTFTDVGAGETTFVLENHQYEEDPGFMCCGTSPTSLTKRVAATGVAGVHTGVFTGLTKGVKYYFQYKPTPQFNERYTAKSGIYHHVQLA